MFHQVPWKKFYCLGWTIIYPGNKFYAQNIFVTKEFVLKEMVSKKREKRHISSLVCFYISRFSWWINFFLECECLFAARKLSHKKVFYIIFISSSFVNKPKVSFSNPFAFRHSTKIIFYQKNSLQTSYAKTSYQIWKVLAVFFL